MKAKDIKDALSGTVDQVRAHKDGTFTAKVFFFYRHGQTQEKIAEKIKLLLECEILESSEKWNSWPRDSWFEVKFKVK